MPLANPARGLLRCNEASCKRPSSPEWEVGGRGYCSKVCWQRAMVELPDPRRVEVPKPGEVGQHQAEVSAERQAVMSKRRRRNIIEAKVHTARMQLVRKLKEKNEPDPMEAVRKQAAAELAKERAARDEFAKAVANLADLPTVTVHFDGSKFFNGKNGNGVDPAKVAPLGTGQVHDGPLCPELPERVRGVSEPKHTQIKALEADHGINWRQGAWRDAILADKAMLRPRTWGDCCPEGVEVNTSPPVYRPRGKLRIWQDDEACPWVGCKYHLALTVNPATGFIRPMKGWDDGRGYCALELAEEYGGMTLEQVGEVVATTRERVRQIETKSLVWIHGLRRAADSKL